MNPLENEAPSLGRGGGARTVAATDSTLRVTDLAAKTQRRRLPAFGRAIRANLLAGKRPRIGGGCVCIVTDWAIHTPLVTMVCEPSIPVKSWKLDFLAGVEVLLLVHGLDAGYGVALRDALLEAGCPLVSMHTVPESEYGL
jgi:hypothetical protein